MGLKRGPLTLGCENLYIFPDIESKLITSQKNHAQSIILLPTFFNCFPNLTALAHSSKSLTLDCMSNNFDCMSNNFFQRESLCSGTLKYKWRHLYFDLQCQEHNFFDICNLLQSTNGSIQSILIRPPTYYATLSSLVFTSLRYVTARLFCLDRIALVTAKRVTDSYDDMRYNWLTSALCIYLNSVEVLLRCV